MSNARLIATILDVDLIRVMLVDDLLTIVPELRYTRFPLTIIQSHQVLSDCRELMKRKYGIMRHVADMFVVRQNRNNYVNVRIKRDYVNTVFVDFNCKKFFCIVLFHRI
jgi:hypothetical protein